MNNSLLETIAEALQNSVAQIMMVLPNLLGAFILLLLGWIIAKLVALGISRILSKIGLESLANKLNDTDFFKDMNFQLQPVKIIRGFVYWLLMLVFILSAADVLGLKIVTQQVGNIINYLPRLFSALIIVVAGLYLSDTVKKSIANTCKTYGVPGWRLISSAIFYILGVAVFITALNQAQIDTQVISFTVYILIAGLVLSFAVAYGVAARGVLASILGAFYSKNIYQIGQIIAIEGHKGEIVRIDTISITLDTGNELIVFPINKLLSEKIMIYKKRDELPPVNLIKQA